MKQNLKDFLFNLVISMLIGAFVCIARMTLKIMTIETVEELIMFSIIGGVIGTISRLVFIYMVEIKQRNLIAGFICVFVIIGVISCTPSLYDYFIHKANISMTELMPILIIAELLGMSFCYYSYKRCLKFNSKLMSKKKQLLGKF